MRTFETLRQDLHYAARLLRTNPGFATVAILSLTLGIGANTAIFQLLDAVRLRTLPVKDPQELAFVRISNRHWTSGRFNGWYSWLTNPQWEQIRDQQQAFSSIFAFGGERLNLARGGEAHFANVMWVSGEAFSTLGVPAMLGRVLNASDDRRGCPAPAAVISYGFWQRQFGGNRSALGSTLWLEGHAFDIVGVTPANFFGIDVGRYYDVAIPICSEPIVNGEYSQVDKRRDWWLGIMGRLKPGWNLEKATAQLAAISPAVFEATIPSEYDADGIKHYREYKLEAIPGATGTSSLRREYEDPLWLLLGIAALVLLIACANLANLILARASARQAEIAVRLALGASRARLIRQLLSESLMMSIIGAVCGALLAQILTRFLVSFLSTGGSQVFVNLAVDWRILGFTAALAMLTCMLFGLTPALRATSVAPNQVMNTASRGLTSSRERFGLRRALVVSQIALSLVLVAGALLFVRSLRNLTSVDAGFSQAGILIVDVDFSKFYVAKDQRNEYKRQILEGTAAVPGIEDAALVALAPISGNGWGQTVVLNGQEKGGSDLNRVSPGYFRTMGTPLIAGRDFNSEDTATSPQVAIVNQAFEKKYLGGNALGKTFKLDHNVGEPDPTYEVVGVVKNSKYYDMREHFRPIGFFPQAQDWRPDQFTEIVIRSGVPFETLTPAIKRRMAEINPEISIDFHVFKTQIRDGLLRERLMAALSGFFGGLAGLLAVIGLYGVVAYMVARRTNEIGIRMALGATPENVLSMILREAGTLLGFGLASGAIVMIPASRTAKAMLFGLKPYDPATLVFAVVGLGAVAIAASYIPARRAAALQPMTALREE